MSIKSLLWATGAVLIVSALALAAFASPTFASAVTENTPALTTAWGSCSYVVRDGDDLFRIAQRQGVPYYAMMSMNGLYSPNFIYRGMMLRMPCANGYGSSYNNGYSTNYGYGSSYNNGYSTNYGQSYNYGGSYGYGSSNNYGSSYGYGSSNNYGSSYGYGSSYNYGSICSYHIVAFGENLYRIGLRYGMSWVNLAFTNRLYNPNRIYAGMRLAIPCQGGASPYGSNANPYGTSPNPYGAPSTGMPVPTAVPGQSSNVTIQDFMFAPASITIRAGQSVTWRNNGPSQHTTTSDNGAWDSGTLNVGATFSHTFSSAGTFTYHCTIHPTMHGTITVTQ